MQPVGPIAGTSIEHDRGDDKTKADPDLWRHRAEEARARAGVSQQGNIRTALLSIAEGFERLGLRARDGRHAEPRPVMPGPPPAAAAPSDPVDRMDKDRADRTERDPAGNGQQDPNLAETFRVMEALGPNPQAPAGANPDRIERVARALCQADGRDPERSIETGQWETVVARGLQTRRPVTLRGWKVYEKDARLFLAAFDAAQDRS
jgi:hypothetical protein